MALYRYTSLFLKVHIIEHLSFCYLNSIRVFKEPVCQCAFSVVYMSNYAKVSNVYHKQFVTFLFFTYIIRCKYTYLFSIINNMLIFFLKKMSFLTLMYVKNTIVTVYNVDFQYSPIMKS